MAAHTASDEKNNSDSSQPRLVVISGITSGIGEGLLHELMKRNHKVVGFGRNEEKIKDLQKQYNINAEKDPNLFVCVMFSRVCR